MVFAVVGNVSIERVLQALQRFLPLAQELNFPGVILANSTFTPLPTFQEVKKPISTKPMPFSVVWHMKSIIPIVGNCYWSTIFLEVQS